MPAAAGRMPAVHKTKKPDWTILHNKFPPTPRVGLVRRRMFSKRRIAQLSFFFLRRSFSVAVSLRDALASRTARRLQNEVDRTNILAPGFASFPPSPPKCFRRLAQWEVVSSYSSATAPDSHGISCADPLFQARKELEREIATQAVLCKIYLSLHYKAPAQRNNRAAGRERFLLLGES